MIPLKKLLAMRKKPKRAIACDSADGDECHAKDRLHCPHHGIPALEREGDMLDKTARDKNEVYFKNLADSMTEEEVRKELAEHFSYVIADEEGLKKIGRKLTTVEKVVAERIISESVPVLENELEDTKRCVAATLKYMKDEHSEVKIPEGMLLFAMKNKRQGRRGQTVCSVDGDSYSIGIGFSCIPIVKNDYTYCHGDYRDNYDYFRHELFHAIEAECEIDASSFQEKMIAAIGTEKAKREILKVSRYAAERKEETEAEFFSKLTADEYDGSISEKVTEIVMADVKGDNQ